MQASHVVLKGYMEPLGTTLVTPTLDSVAVTPDASGDMASGW